MLHNREWTLKPGERCLKPHEERDQRAIACFDQALQDTGLDSDERLTRVLHDYFASAPRLRCLVTHDSAEDVPDGLHITKWSWNGLINGAETGDP